MRNMETWVCAEGKGHYNLDRDDFYNQLYSFDTTFSPPMIIIIDQNQETIEKTINDNLLTINNTINNLQNRVSILETQYENKET